MRGFVDFREILIIVIVNSRTDRMRNSMHGASKSPAVARGDRDLPPLCHLAVDGDMREMCDSAIACGAGNALRSDRLLLQFVLDAQDPMNHLRSNTSTANSRGDAVGAVADASTAVVGADDTIRASLRLRRRTPIPAHPRRCIMAHCDALRPEMPPCGEQAVSFNADRVNSSLILPEAPRVALDLSNVTIESLPASRSMPCANCSFLALPTSPSAALTPLPPPGTFSPIQNQFVRNPLSSHELQTEMIAVSSVSGTCTHSRHSCLHGDSVLSLPHRNLPLFATTAMPPRPTLSNCNDTSLEPASLARVPTPAVPNTRPCARARLPRHSPESSARSITGVEFIESRASPFCAHAWLHMLESRVWFRRVRLLLLVVTAVAFLLVPVSLMRPWVLVLLVLLSVPLQFSLVARVDVRLFARILRMFEFYFVLFNLAAFIGLSVLRNYLAYEVLVPGASVSRELFVGWRFFGPWTVSFVVLNVVSQDASIVVRAEKANRSLLFCVSGVIYWVFSRFFSAAVGIAEIVEPEVCTPSGACFTPQRLRLDAFLAALLFACNCARLLLQHPERMCFIKSTLSLRRIVPLTPMQQRCNKHPPPQLRLLNARDVVLMSTSVRLLRRLVRQAAAADAPLRAIRVPSLAHSSVEAMHELSAYAVRTHSLLADEFGTAAFPSRTIAESDLCRSRVHSVALFWLLSFGLLALYFLGEPRSWLIFVLVNGVAFTLWLRIEIAWFHRGVLTRLVQNFEWWYLLAIASFYYACTIATSTSPLYVTTIRANSGLGEPDGSVTASNLALLTVSYLAWNFMLTVFNVLTISLDAVSPPYAQFKLHFAFINWATNLAAMIFFCVAKTGVAAVSPRLCLAVKSDSCDTTFSLQIQALYVLSLFSLKYCLYLTRSPRALLVLRASIHLSAYRKAAVELS